MTKSRRRRRRKGRHVGLHRWRVLLLILVCVVVAGGVCLVTLSSEWFPRDVSTRSVARLASETSIVGRASVIDGDTIEIQNVRIRFNGIDAPEANQICRHGAGATYRCGSTAAQFLDDFLAASRPTRCDFVERDRYGRFVSNCFRADGAAVAEALVRAGHAVDWPRYSHGAYSEAQSFAKTNKLGLWRGGFDMPWDFRAGKRSRQEPVSATHQ